MKTNTNVLSKQEYVAALIEQFYNDFVYDCHSVETRYNRSRVRQELIDCGPAALHAVAGLIEDKFPNLDTANKALHAVNWELFLYIVYLITEIRRAHELPAAPYPTDLQFGKQNMRAWHEYCLQHAI